mmetsp:Transcript_64904/g.169908  ORF Transcript_64904/g.169908 Transcript_64904/m.169908 type:complete len:424 (+) Transcript_64904:1138-2409(+)
MPAVDVPAVHHHRVEDVDASVWREAAQVQTPVELELRVQLHHVHLLEVEVEPLELQVEHRREGQEADALLGLLLPVPLRLVGVVALEGLLRGELLEGLLDAVQLLTPLPLDVQLDVVEGLVASRLVVHVDALDVVLHLPLEEPLDGAVHRRALHLLLKAVAEDPVELLSIVLREGVHRVPPEGLHQLPAVHGLLRSLQSVEDVLQGVDERRRLASIGLALVGGLVALPARVLGGREILLARRVWRVFTIDGVDDLPELAHVEEALEKPVHVAGGSVVHEADAAGLLPVVVVVAVDDDAVRLPAVARRPDEEGVVGAEPAGLGREVRCPHYVVPAAVDAVLREGPGVHLDHAAAVVQPIDQRYLVFHSVEHPPGVQTLQRLGLHEGAHLLAAGVVRAAGEDEDPEAEVPDGLRGGPGRAACLEG